MVTAGEDGTGGVPIREIASWPRMAAITNDLSRVVAAMRQMEQLAVSDDGKTVARRDVLGERDTTSAC